MSEPIPFAPAQQARLEQFHCTRSVDVHCHVLPGIDDGPRTLTESLALCRLLVQDGLTDIIATPHQLGRWDGANHARQIRQAVSELQSRLDATGIPLKIHVGGEVRLDERIPQLIGAGTVLTLADQGTHLLLELPMGLTPDPAVLVKFLSASGMRIVLAHAERYDTFLIDPQSAQAWVSQGIALQVNAASLLEQSRQAEVAWQWLAAGWIAVIATDAHGLSTRRPRMSEAIDQMIARCGLEIARRACVENPTRLLLGQELV